MSTNGLVHRLERLEAIVPSLPSVDVERDRQLMDALEQLTRTMSAEHTHLLIEGIQSRHAQMAEVGHGARHLANVALTLIFEHLDHPSPRFRLALPPALAQVLLDHPSIWFFDRCVRLPARAAVRRRTLARLGRRKGQRRVPEVHFFFFDRCPDCGGAVEHDTYGFARVPRREPPEAG